MVAVNAVLVQVLLAVVLPLAAAAESIAPPGFAWPVEGRVIDNDDARRGPASGEGIDILVPEGTEVRASRAGTVIYAGSGLARFGNLVILSHEGGWVTVYGHNSELFVNRGEKVQTGDVIAKSGRTGHVARPQLRFEIRMKEDPLNPARYLPLLELQELEIP